MTGGQQHRLDISPYHVVFGHIEDSDTLADDVGEQVLTWLRDRRILGSVSSAHPEAGLGLGFFLAAGPGGVAALDDDGRLVAGPELSYLRVGLATALGETVHLLSPLSPGEDDATPAPTHVDLLDDEIAPVVIDSVDAPQGPDSDDLDPQILTFSRRGPAWAGLIAMLAGTGVDVAVRHGWSVLRFVGQPPHVLFDPGTGEGPSLLVSLNDASESTYTYLQVDVRGRSLTDLLRSTLSSEGSAGPSYLLFPLEHDRVRSVLQPSQTEDPMAERLIRVLTNGTLAADSDVNLLLSEPEFADADAALLHAAFAPRADGAGIPSRNRISDALTALGVPRELVAAALDGTAPEAFVTYSPRGFWPTLLRMAEDGYEASRPLQGRVGPLVAAERFLRSRPSLGVAVSTAQVILGVRIIAAARGLVRRSASGAVACGVVGALIAGDGVLEVVLHRRRAASPRPTWPTWPRR